MPNTKNQKRRAEGDRDAHSVDEFCERNNISRSTYYDLRRQGLGPKEMKVGKRRIISVEAAAEWRRAMEARAA